MSIHRTIVVTAMIGFVAPSAPAQHPIPVSNASFEDPPLADGALTNGVIPSWVVNAGVVGVYNPTTDHYCAGEVPDGQQVAYSWGVAMSQGNFTGGNLGTYASTPVGMTYTLTVEVGHRCNAMLGIPQIALRYDAGGGAMAVLASATGADPLPGEFATLTVSHTVMPGAPEEGLPVDIFLSGLNATFPTDFDHVRLTRQAIANVPGDMATIQDAIDLMPSDPAVEIVLAPGVHREGEIESNGKTFMLRSTDPDDPDVVASTVISGDLDDDGVGDTWVLQLTGPTSEPRVSGLVIEDGRAEWPYAGGAALQITECSAHIDRCLIRRCDMGELSLGGGAVYCSDAHVEFTQCRFGLNTTAVNGGAVLLASIPFGERTTFYRCVFIGNTAASGGAIASSDACFQAMSCLFVDNHATDDAAAIRFFGDTPSGAPFDLVNCTFSGNSDGLPEDVLIAAPDMTFDPATSNSVYWGNEASGFAIPSGMSFWACVVDGGLPQDALDFGWNFEADPMLDASHRPLACSPVIDAGATDAAVGGGPHDLVGAPRFVDDPGSIDSGLPGALGVAVDIGAFEFQGVSVDCCPSDVDGSGAVDTADLLALIGAWGPCTGCLADLDGDGIVATSDLLALIGAWGACP